MGSSWRDRPGKQQKPERPSSPPPSESAPPATPTRAGWRKPTQSGPAPRSQWQHGTSKSLFTGTQVKLALFGLLSLGLLAVFVYSQIRILVKVPLVAFVCTGYREPFPPNSLAQEDLQRWKQLFAGSDQNLSLEIPTLLAKDRDKFLEDFGRTIASLTPGGPNRDCVVIYLSAHGAVGKDDQPCLILPDSKPLDSGTWLPIAELLAKTDQIQGDRTKILLLLDSSKLNDCWPAGIVYNGFTESLTRFMDQQGSRWSRVAIINSTHAGQTAALLPEAGGSLFGLFCAAGLEGYADNGDDRITLQELLSYLQERVSVTAHDRRDVSQIPQLIPAQPANFPLDHPVAHADTGRLRSIPVTPLADLTSDTSEQLWKRYDELRQQKAYHRDPLRWSMLRQSLLRIDQLRVAGSDYTGSLADTRTNVDRLMKELEVSTNRLPAASSLAIWRRQRSSTAALTQKLESDLKTARSQLEAREAKEAELAAAAPVASTDLPSTATIPADDATSASPTSPPSADGDAPASPAAPPSPPAELPPLPTYELLAQLVWDRWQQTPWDETLVQRDLVRLGHQDEAVFRELQFLRILQDGLQGLGDPAIVQPVRQNALALQQLAEQAGAPVEPRCFYWIADKMGQADQQLRQALDLLLVGEPNAWNQAEDVWHTLADNTGLAYPLLIAQGEQIARAFELRDQLSTDLPQYARWAILSENSSDLDSIGRLLQQLTAANRRLSELLLDPRFDSENWQELERLLTNATQQFKDLQGFFQQECNLREKDIVSRESLRKIETVIRVAIIPGKMETTTNLRKRYWTHAFESMDASGLWERHSSDQGQWSENRRLPAATTIGLPILDQWLTRLDLPASTEQSLTAEPSSSNANPSDSALSMAAENARQSLAKLNEYLDEQSSKTIKKLSTEQASGLEPRELVRQDLARADQRLRIWAEFLATPPWNRESDNPSAQLSNLDQFFFALWQAERGLQDYWGSPPPATSIYFASLVEQQLASARSTFRNAKPYLRVLEGQLQQSLTALQAWNPLDTDDLEATADETRVRHTIAVRPSPDMPSAIACVRVTDLSGNTIPLVDPANRSVDRRPVPIQQGQELSHLFQNAKLIAANANTLDALITFRGHRRPVQFHVDTDRDSAIALWKAPDFVRPQVTVKGSKLERAQVLFVLDCSSSMQYLHDWQRGDGGPTTRMTRMEIATTVLANVLNHLSAEHYDVGLMLYGHRLGWDRDATSKQFRPVYKKGAQAVTPGEDAELVHRIRRLDEESRNSLFVALDDLAPYGETPLYFAIKKAAEQFRSGPQAKIIVVLTDGANNIFQEPPGGGVTIRDLQSIPELTDRAAADRRIQLNILGLVADPAKDSPKDHLDAWQRDRRRWFDEGEGARVNALVRQTGGRFYEVSKFSELEETLESTLQEKQFFVTPAGQPDPAPRDWVQLDQAWRLPDQWSVGNYQVQLAGLRATRTDVTLESGAWLELDYNPKSGQMEHRRFDGKSPESKYTVDGYYIAGHLPDRTGTRNVTFRVSVQNADGRLFSQRPAAVWAEIRPDANRALSDADASPTIFYAYDLDFEAKRPVPVLQFKIQNWPASEQRSLLNVWISPDPIDQLATPVSLDWRKPSSHETLDTTFNVEPVQSTGPRQDNMVTLQIEEVHARPDAPPCYLQFVPQPVSIEHRFQTGRAKHIVTFQRDTLKREDVTMLVLDKKQIVEKWIPSAELSESLPSR